jgi:type I restriction enzyme M protein
VNLDLRPSHIEVKENQIPADVIGAAYEYMIGEFAGMAGKKAGSFYTPAAVSEIMARIADARSGERIYDPTCGSGSLLIKAAKRQDKKQVSIYGQEVNGSSVSMAKMNMFIHQINDAHIAWGDTLANPLFLDADGNLMLFDVIVANMPFSKDKWAAGFNTGGETAGKGRKEFKMDASLDRHHRFDWCVPPASKGDWAFLLHMIASCARQGRIAAVAPHGVLFRSGTEGIIRKRVIDENLLDAVIGLPENVFFGTTIPACILVFKKDRQNKDIVFIDASKKDKTGKLRYIKGKNQNILEEKHINDIVQAYQKRKNIPRFVHAASLKEIIENDYNLNIPRYVDTFEEEEIIDIEEVRRNIKRLKSEITKAEAKMDGYLKEMGL